MPRIFIVFNILEFLFAHYSIFFMPDGGGGDQRSPVSPGGGGQPACLLAHAERANEHKGKNVSSCAKYMEEYYKREKIHIMTRKSSV